MNASQKQYFEWKKPYKESTHCMILNEVLEWVELIYDEKNNYSVVATVDVGERTKERGER